MKILKFDDFVLNESLTEFGFNHVSATGITGSGISQDTTQPNDPQLTTDGWDRHKNNIMNAQNRLADIMRSIFDLTPFAPFGQKEVDLKIDKLKINRMYRNESASIDIYIEYGFDHIEKEFYNGVFKQWGSNYKPKFRSQLTEQTNDKFASSKVVALIRKALEKWFKPLKGEYMLLKDSIGVWTDLGEKEQLNAGDIIVVKEVRRNNYKPTIFLESKGHKYKLTNLDYWYFNWWFEPISKPKLKI